MNADRQPKALFAAGGTGGHVFPAIAVAKELQQRRPDAQIAFVGTQRRMESTIAPKEGFRFIAMDGAGFPRGMSWRWLPTIYTLGKSGAQAAMIIRKERPRAVFGTGGYVCGPIMAAAAFSGVPTIVHESNAAAGTANRWLGKMVKEVHVAFPDAVNDFPKNKTRVTGNPIRPEIVQAAQEKHAHVQNRPSCENGKLTLLVLGGSQGARSINDAVVDALPAIEKMGGRVLHQTGRGDFERVQEAYLKSGRGEISFSLNEAGGMHTVLPFVENMGAAYQQADMALARSGALTVSELILFSIPSILVPLPIAKTQGEYRNAQFVEDAGAGFILSDADLSGKTLIEKLKPLMMDPARRAEMSKRFPEHARPDAARQLAEAVNAYL